jgi:hypothetical protein
MHIPREGFGKFSLTRVDATCVSDISTTGWTNASVVLGLTFITQHQRRALGALTPPETFFKVPAIPR